MYTPVARMVEVTAIVTLLSTMSSPARAQHENHTPAATPQAQPLLGTVRCAEGPPLAGAIVQLFHEAGSELHLVSSALTDRDGRFVIRSASGSYRLRISYLGHSSSDQLVTVATSPLNVGTLPLEIEALQMAALEVSAERERIQLRSGATIIDARSAATAAGGSVADLLRTVPGLAVTPDGEIEMRGSTNVLVLVNGRRTPLSGDALIAFLKQMPASSLERIEAGTSASARQDADGAAGIVNLVFADGVRGATAARSLAVSAATEDTYSASGSASGMVNDVLAWNGSYSYSAMRPVTTSRTLRTSLLPDDPAPAGSQDSHARAAHRLHAVALAATAQLTPQTTLGARTSYSWMRGAYANATDFSDTGHDGVTEARRTNSVLEHTIPTATAAALFEWRAGGSHPPRVGLEVSTTNTTENFDGAYDNANGLTFLHTTMDSERRTHVVQSDIAFQLAAYTIEIGQKLQLRTLRAGYVAARDDASAVDAFELDDRVTAFYASAHGPLAGLEIQGGLRVEAERSTVRMERVHQSDRLRAFPNLLLQWPRRDDASGLRYRVSYARRINRPDAAELNPYSMGEDDMNAFVGNPRLRPEIADQLEVGIERTGARTAFQLTPFIRVIHDPIRPLKAVTESGRATTTLANLSMMTAIGADASLRARMSPLISTTVAASMYEMSTRGNSYSNSGVHMTARATVDVRIAERTTLQAYAYRRGARIIEQGRILPSSYTDLALTQTFGNADRGRITFRVSDPLASERLAFHIVDPTFIQHTSRRVTRPLASVFLSWAVGAAPAREPVHRNETPPRIF